MICEQLRRKLCETPVTLNGKPAVISGIHHPFASVRYADDTGGFTFAWDTAWRVVADKDGAFTS